MYVVSSCSTFWQKLNRAHRETIAPVVVVLRVDSRRIEVHVVGVSGGVERTRPVVAVRPAVVERRTIVVARSGEEHTSNTVTT